MMATRDATHDDVPALVEMGERFVLASPYAAFADATPDSIAAGFRALLNHGGFVRVAESDGRIVGMLVAFAVPLWFAAHTGIASELAWWIEPEHRGGRDALRLVQDYEEWARQQGVRAGSVSDLIDENGKASAGRLLEHLGYRLVEQSHVKEF